ncbi:AAA family ATPase [Rhizobium sophoriradicis]|uniref:TrlF family AAA-like ATPase n=1 Tax=Rhizobium sophoriradicis TaxID=1535245 RepID=UPI00160FEC70|nr:AAA family ATPase [Rhizobium leguminosarum bv. phaseoli]
MLADNGRPLKKYRGSRFFKCDLQMQTPFDTGHWVGEGHQTVEAAAEAYIRRCYEVDLEVIALTEHNFVSKQHIPVFQQKAKKFAEEFGYELVIFPGFEFTANVGKGVHVLALFEPNANLEHLDHILTECGVPSPRQNESGQHEPSTKSLDEIIRIIQASKEKGGKRGLVVLPHIQSNSGIFDGEKIAEWLQQKEFTNPELLAVEVPKSPSKMNKAFQKLFGNGDDCQPGWKRTRSICCVMSSDAKTLVANDLSSNAIGSKYTWIKMSTPSIEALRQAFLDHESRIRRSDEYPGRPELAHTHPHIESIRIGGAKFLADEEIHFSQNLTTLIGGRGTGKSTLVEYLRIALEQENALGTDTKSQLFIDFENVRDTLGLPGSMVEVTYNKGADFKNQKILLSVENGLAKGIDASFGDINTYLPIKIYSRGQIEAIANDPQKQASIIDDLILAPLEALKNEERDVVRRLRDLNESLRQEPDVASARGKLVADISNLNAQIEAIQGRSSGLEKWSKWNGERQYLIGLEGAATEHVDRYSTTVVGNAFSYKEADQPGENTSFLNSHRQRVEKALSDFQTEIANVVANVKQALTILSNSDERAAWQTEFEKIDAENKATVKELAEMGISFEAYDELFRRRETAQSQLVAQEKRLAEIVSNREEFNTIYTSKLLDIWKRQFELRQDMATRLNGQVTKTKIGTPTVKSEITKHGDFKSFAELMAAHHKDKRIVSQADWEAMLKAAFDVGLQSDQSPLDVIESWIKLGGTPPGFPADDVQPKKLTSMGEWLSECDINELRTNRISDAVTVSLNRREDGKRVGDLVGRKLSAGQKATTVLSLLLAEGTCPIVIDQPEDDLDNEFVFEQLVPMLRASKEKRQIIVVTHNANVPVNGDAELIVPLEVRDSRGTQKTIENELTVGALDRHPVQRAVELILEGSSEAFRRRREKYGV